MQEGDGGTDGIGLHTLSGAGLHVGRNGNLGTEFRRKLWPGDAGNAVDPSNNQLSTGLLGCSGVPLDIRGDDGDWCLSDNGHLYFKTGGAWAQKV